MRIKTLLLTALCLICTTPVFADFTDGDFTFRENGSNCTLIAYNGAGGDVTIPSSATNAEDGATYAVTAIGSEAFYYRESLTSVIIPDGVLEIGQWAFPYCYNLAEVTIGNSVETIGDYAFYNCTNLAEVTIGNSVRTIGYSAFGSCSSLAEVTIPNSVTIIGIRAFYGCSSLAEVTIGNSVETIGELAFYFCASLAEVTIPESVTIIGIRAFGYCRMLTEINVADGNISWASENGVLYNKGKSILHICPGGKSGSFTIPSFVTEIASVAFLGCRNLSSITIPNSVASIGIDAFVGCFRLTAINVDEGSISWASEDGILYNKSKSLLFTYPAGKSGSLFTVPSSVTEIASSAFSSCINLSSITIPNSVTTIGNSAFFDCSSLTEVTIPNSVTTIGDYAFDSCIRLASVLISNSVTTIRYGTFYSCSSLTSVVIPNSVTTIGGYAFIFCSSLASVEIPNSVTDIGNNAFYGCSSLASVEIPNLVTTIGDLVFYGCSSLTSVVIPNSVTTIGYMAFYYCTGLTSVVIPNSVTNIGYNAFYNCTGLTDVTVSWPTPLVVSEGDYIFRYVDFANCTLHVPAGTEDLYAAAEVWRDFNIVASSTTPDEPEDDNLMPTAVALNLNEVSLKAGETVQLTATVSPDDAINKEVIWESSDTEVATVSSTGLVTALSEGTATITVTTAYRSHTDECIVTVTKDDDDEGNDDSVEAVNSNKPEVNISNGILTVTSPATEQVEVYSLTGALLHKESKASGTLTLNIGHLPKGILIVRGNSGWTQKIILK